MITSLVTNLTEDVFNPTFVTSIILTEFAPTLNLTCLKSDFISQESFKQLIEYEDVLRKEILLITIRRAFYKLHRIYISLRRNARCCQDG